MNCNECKHHYIGNGCYCWSGNKSLGYCNNGKPTKERKTYNVKKNKLKTFENDIGARNGKKDY